MNKACLILLVLLAISFSGNRLSADTYVSPFCNPAIEAGTTTNKGWCRPPEDLCDWDDCLLAFIDSVDALIATMGTGDVEGPVSWTDNTIVRADGTDGTAIQGSSCTIDDAGSIACSQHATDGGAITVYEGVDDGTNYFSLQVPNAGLSQSRDCVLESNAVVPADCLTGVAGYFDVRTEGADCNGATDDAVAIQAAEDAADDVCGTVFIPYGTCVTGSTIVVSDCVSIAGAGAGSILKAKSDLGNVAVIENEDEAPADDASRDGNITIRDLTIDASANVGSTANACIQLTSVVDARVSNVTCIEPDGDCVDILPGSTETVTPERNTVSGLHCLDPDQDGINITAGKRLNIVGNQIHSPDRHGVNVDLQTTATLLVDDLTISGNVIEGAGALATDCAVRLSGDTSGQIIRNVSVTGNTINEPGHGVCLRHTTNASITGNTVHSPSGNGIYSLTSSDSPVGTVISGNVIDTIAGHGIQWLRTEGVSITGNHISAATNHGIYITNAASPSVVGNVVDTTGTGYDCVAIGDTTNAVIAGNSLLSCDVYGVSIGGSVATTGTVVSGNSIDATTACVLEVAAVGVDTSNIFGNSFTTCGTELTLVGTDSVALNVVGGELSLSGAPLVASQGLGAVAATSPPQACAAAIEGMTYTDSDLHLPCFCDGTDWVQMDDYSTVCS